jgi:argininosuccinate lyase
MLSTAVFHPPEPSDWVTALDLAEALVERGVPFREAHHLVGGVVAYLVARGETLSDLTESQLVEVDGRFAGIDLSVLDVTASVRARATPGGGSMSSVEIQVVDLQAFLGES